MQLVDGPFISTTGLDYKVLDEISRFTCNANELARMSTTKTNQFDRNSPKELGKNGGFDAILPTILIKRQELMQMS